MSDWSSATQVNMMASGLDRSIAMPPFYKAKGSPWISQRFLFTNPNLHLVLLAFDGRDFAMIESVRRFVIQARSLR